MEKDLTPLQQHVEDLRAQVEGSKEPEPKEPVEPQPIIEEGTEFVGKPIESVQHEDEEDDAEPEVKETKDSKDSKDVSAFIHERIKTRKVKEENTELKELVEALKAQNAPPAPDTDVASKPSPWDDEEKYEAYITQKAEEKIRGELEPIKQQLLMQQFQQEYKSVESERAALEAKDPTLKAAFNHIQTKIAENIIAANPNYNMNDVMFELNRLEIEEYRNTGLRGEHLANHYKNLAAANGFNPPALESLASSEEEPERNLNDTRKLKDKATTLAGIPSKASAKKTTKITPQEFMAMTTGERAKLPKDVKRQIMASI